MSFNGRWNAFIKKVQERVPNHPVDDDGFPRGTTKYESYDAKTKQQRAEMQYTKKRCVCGMHSWSGYKSKSKYPVWKKKSRKNLNE